MNFILVLLGFVTIAIAVIFWIRTGKKPADEIRTVDTWGSHVEYHVPHYEKYGVWLFVIGVLLAIGGFIWT